MQFPSTVDPPQNKNRSPNFYRVNGGGTMPKEGRRLVAVRFLLQRARSAMKAFGCIVHRPPEIAAQTTLLPDRVLADLVGQTWPQNHPKATWGLAPGHKKTAPTDQI